MLFQGVQDRRSIAVFITGVKGEIEDLFIGHLGIGGVVLHKLVGGGVGCRRLAFSLEAQAPVPVGIGSRRGGRPAPLFFYRSGQGSGSKGEAE